VLDNKEDLEVEAELQNCNDKLELLEKNLTLRRVWTVEGRELYFLNEKELSSSQWTHLLDCLGISRENPFNIVQQGKISKIANMKEDALYNLLSEVAGVLQFVRKAEEAEKIISQISNLSTFSINIIGKEKECIEESLAAVGERASALSHRKNEMEQLSKDQLQAKA